MLVAHTVPASAQQTSATASAVPAPQFDEEVVEQRSATSRTFAQDDGSLVTRVYSLPVNFREDGDWRRIDTTLVEADRAGYVHQRANDGDVEIPRDLSDPIRVSYDGAWLSFEMHGGDASAAAQLDDDTAHFDHAATGVNATYEATNVGVKETLTLADASAQRQFVYDIAASDGLSAHELERGVVEFRDADGHDVFRFTAPVAWDEATAPSADGRVTSDLERTATGWTLRLTVDEGWLSSPDRRFPVKVDPIVQWQPGGVMRYSGAQQDCTVASGTLAATSLCTEPTLKVGADATHTYKSLLSFNTPSAIEQDSVVAYATLLMHAGGTGTAPTSNLRVRPITSSWTSAATWNSRDGSNAWSTPGGTVSTAAADLGAATAVAQLDSWYQWRVPADIVQRWVWGTQPDFGLQVSADPGSPQTVYSFDATEFDPYKRPAIDIYWRRTAATRQRSRRTCSASATPRRSPSTWRTAR